MKALICALCVDIRALPQHDHEVVECRCGNAQGMWTDALAGKAKFYAKSRDDVFVLGINNTFLSGAVRLARDSEQASGDWRLLHAVAVRCPGYLFDELDRSCWAILFKPGQSGDTALASKPLTSSIAASERTEAPEA